MTNTCGERVESNCPFCNVKQFEEQLIAEVDGFYIVATLGQITDGGYILLIPRDHISCLGILPDNQLPGLFNNIFKVSTAISREYFDIPVMIFEHGIVGQIVKHAHLHLLPQRLVLPTRSVPTFQQ
ncbi:MAG: HIT domain-containing protein [Candidatus Yanofskybacteria bacterium]|nr:HIT domain-containing protein [Candidatus Yanofskybacteria bacterium]